MSDSAQPTNAQQNSIATEAKPAVENGGTPASQTDSTATEATEEALAVVEKDPWFAKAGEAGITVGLLTLLLFLRLFAVARWDWSVAASLSQSFNFDDAVAILLGTLFERPSLSGLIITLALPIAIFRDYWLSSSKITKARANNWFLIVALIATAYVLTRTAQLWWIPVATLFLTSLLIGVSMMAKHKGWRSDVARLGTHIGIAVGVALLAIASTVDTPWLERERIVTEQETIFGYVLDSDPGFLKIMTEDREVLIVPDQDVVSRTIIEV